MMPNDAVRRYKLRSKPPQRKLTCSADQAAMLLNLLSDNARAWNAPLRAQLHQVVSPTEAYNARLRTQGGNGSGPHASTD